MRRLGYCSKVATLLLLLLLGLVFPARHTNALPVSTTSLQITRALDERVFAYVGLWDGKEPSLRDPKQVKVLDCWLVASSMSVLHVSSWWTMSLFSDFNSGISFAGWDTPAAGAVNVSVWDPSSSSSGRRQQYNFTARIEKESETEDHPGGNWWHDALTQAVLQLGAVVDVPGVFSDGTFDPTVGSPEVGLAVLTGYEAVTTFIPTSGSGSAEGDGDVDGGLVDGFFEDLTKAPKTPIVVSTKDEVETTEPEMNHNHAYAVLNTTVQATDGSRWVTCRNPWGATTTFRVEDVWRNCWGYQHLKDWNELVWPGH